MTDDQEDDHYAGISFGDFGTYMRHKKRKLQDQLEQVAARAPKELPQIFEGVVFYINGYTVPPIHEIRDMMVQRGGEYRQYLSKSQITHIIAMNLTQAKMNEFKNYKVVRPEWVLDSVKAGMRLPWHRYSVLRVAGSLQQFGTRLTASPSKQASSLIPDSGNTASQSQQGTPSASRPAITDLVPSPPQEGSTSLSTPLPSTAPSPSNQLDINDDHVDQMLEGKDVYMEWDSFDFDGLDEPFSLSPVPPRENQPILVNSTIGAGSEASDSHHQPLTSAEPLQDTLAPLSLTGPVRPASILGFNLIRVAKPNITPSPVGSLEGETQESFAELSFVEDSRLPIEEEASVDRAGVNAASISGVDDRHPTLVELSNAWNRKNSSVEPGFVAKFFQSSRLHYLSTWKAKLREMMADIQKKEHKTSKSKLDQQSIMHIDFDCFFASVGTRDRPELAGKPVGVAHGSGGANSNSEIASCNYLARGFGVKNGMQLKKARSLCPDLVVVPYEFEKYETISLDFYRILLKYADDLQAVSVDEALVDISSRVLPTWNDQLQQSGRGGLPGTTLDTRISPEEFAQKLRDEIFAATGCQASVGIGPNVLLAKLSTKRAKPHGQFIWPSAPGSDRTIQELQGDAGAGSQPEDMGEGLGMANVSMYTTTPPVSVTPTLDEEKTAESSLMPPPRPQPRSGPAPRPKDPRQGAQQGSSISLLPGVGYRTMQELEERFLVKTIFELQQVERAKLQEYCGMKTGEMLYKACRGIDDTEITADLDKKRQSVSAEISWGVRFENETQLERFVQDLSEEVSRRLRDIGRKAKSLVMKIMKRKPMSQGAWKHLGHGPVDQYARTGQLPNYTDDPETIAQEAMRLIHYFKFSPLDLRGIGIQMVKLDHGPQGSLASHSTLYDPVQQTTLAAMFSKQRVANEQRKQESTEPMTEAETGAAVTNLDIVPIPGNHLSPRRNPDACPPVPAPPELPVMEIDRATFEELPEDIQRDLSRNHQLKFLSLDDPQDPSTDILPLGNQQLSPEAHELPSSAPASPDRPYLPPWSQLDPDALQAMSTQMIRKTLEFYAEDPSRRTGRQRDQVEGEEGEEDALAMAQPGGKRGVGGRSGGGESLVTDTVLPSPSKLDRSVLRELPADIRAEIEQEYNAMQENQRLIETLATEGRTDALWLSAAQNSKRDDGKGGNGGGGGGSAGPSTNKLVTTAPGRRRGRPPGSKNKKHHPYHHDESGGSKSTIVVNHPEEVQGAEHHHPQGRQVHTAVADQERDRGEGELPPPPPPLDPEFLAALPLELRAEIEANHQAELIRYQQQQQQSKVTTTAATTALEMDKQSSRQEQQRPISTTEGPQGHGHVGGVLLPTLDGEREIGPLRQMVTLWVESTVVTMALPSDQEGQEEEDCDAHGLSGGGGEGAVEEASATGCRDGNNSITQSRSMQMDKGPNPEDVSDFIEFLVRVVAMERDLDRVQLLIRWLRRKVAESEAHLAQSHRRMRKRLRQRGGGGKKEPGEEEGGQELAEDESEEDDEERQDRSWSKHLFAALSCSQPALTWSQALTRIETAVQGVVCQMYGGTIDFA